MLLLLVVAAATALEYLFGGGVLLYGIWAAWRTHEFGLLLLGFGLAGAAGLSSRWTYGLGQVLFEHAGEGVWGIVRSLVLIPVMFMASWVFRRGEPIDDDPEDEPSPWWSALMQFVVAGLSFAVLDRFVAVPVTLGLTLAALHVIGAFLRAQMP